MPRLFQEGAFCALVMFVPMTPTPQSLMADGPSRVPAPDIKRAEAAQALASWLGGVTGKTVDVVWTTNRSTMLSYRSGAGHIRLRLHQMFAQAGAMELEAIADYVRGRSAKAARTIDSFIARQMPHVQRPPARRLGPSLGAVYDLGRIFAELNAAYFHDSCQARIMWGQAGRHRRAKRSIQLGCYVPEDNLIRMHPCLDQSFVPLYFVTGVVFHEMLHEVFGIGQNATRRAIHPPEFLAVEQSHPDYGRCQAWEKQHLTWLLRWRP